MGLSMLNVPCGISGIVRITLTNSETGRETFDSGEFKNIWTDSGLARISGGVGKHAHWPTNINIGSGAHAAPHNAVVGMHTPVNSLFANFVGNNEAGGVTTSGDSYVVTKTRSAVQPARGVDWSISELGLSYYTQDLDTYTLVKNIQGVAQPIQVSAIEILTVYYTVQVQYPLSLPAQAVQVTGLPPTTATFNLYTAGNPVSFAAQGISQIRVQASAGRGLAGFLTPTGGSSVTGSSMTEDKVIFGIDRLNRETPYFGVINEDVAKHVWTLDPPITKDNTQVLELEVFWQFSNATPIEIL